MPSLLWCCWLGGRKGIQPAKKLSGEVLTWLSVWSEVQMNCIWSHWCHCISYSSESRMGLPFWCRLTQVVLEKRPLNGCSSSSASNLTETMGKTAKGTMKYNCFNIHFPLLHGLASGPSKTSEDKDTFSKWCSHLLGQAGALHNGKPTKMEM